MRAAVLRSFGGPEALELLDWEEPRPGPRDVLIEVHAVTVGRTLDAEVRARGADFHVTPPRILGSDPAGVVLAVGDEVREFEPGDRVVSTSSLFCGECEACLAGATNRCAEHGVLGVHRDGGDAERCVVPAATLVGVPTHVPFDQAASMGVSYPLAWNLLRTAGVGRGDDVLVMGAGGALGIAGIQVAKCLGARVIAAAASQWKLDRCRELLGADAVVDYSNEGWAASVRELSSDGRGVHTVYENISDPVLFPEALSTLRTGGWLVTSGAHGGGNVPLDVRLLYRRHLRIAGETGATMQDARQVFDRVAAGALPPPPVFHRFRLADIAAAHAAAAGRDLFGRAVLIAPAGETRLLADARGAEVAAHG